MPTSKNSVSNPKNPVSDPKNPVPGDLNLNLSDIAVIDVTPEQIQRFTKTRDGLEEAVKCVQRLSPAGAQDLGLNADDIKRLTQLHAEFGRVSQVLPAAEKLAELITETRAERGHRINLLLGEMAAQARRRAERSDGGAAMLGPLAELLAYQYGPAAKGAATRKNKTPKSAK